MRIRLLKSGNDSAEEVVEMRPLFARMLIMLGRAKEAEKTYRLGDLYYGELGYIEDKEVNYFREDEVSDISFWLYTAKAGIFTYTKPEFDRGRFDGGDYYTLLSTNKKVYSTSSFNNINLNKGKFVINQSTIFPLTNMKRVMDNKGWTEDTELTLAQIKEFEREINSQYKYYLNMSKYVC